MPSHSRELVAHPRLRVAVHPAHRPPHPRAARLLRDPPCTLPFERSGALSPARHRALGRAGQRLRRGRAPVDKRVFELGVPDPRHLLRPPAHRAPARRQGRARRRSASTATRGSVVEKPEGVFHRFAKRETLDVWMSHGDRIAALPPGFQTIGVSGNTPFCAVGNAREAHLRRAVPPGGRAHAARRGGARGVPLRRGGPLADLDAGRRSPRRPSRRSRATGRRRTTTPSAGSRAGSTRRSRRSSATGRWATG